MKKLLIIGGTGGIGTGIYPLLKDKYVASFCSSKDFTLPLIASRYGMDEIDIVINLAGVITECDLSTHDILNKKLIEVNCLGAVNILAEFLPYMRDKKYGRIILMSSIFSSLNVAGYGVYSSSKAFVDKLVKIASLENAQHGITVNSIQLGFTGVGMGINTPELARQRPALKRFCTMQEIVNAIDFIVETEYFTGQNLKLCGGIK